MMRGDRLKVDMTSGVSRVEADTGKVHVLIEQSDQGCGSGSDGEKPASRAKPWLIPGKK